VIDAILQYGADLKLGTFAVNLVVDKYFCHLSVYREPADVAPWPCGSAVAIRLICNIQAAMAHMHIALSHSWHACSYIANDTQLQLSCIWQHKLVGSFL
jgi:hypothetical protein